MKRTIGLVGLVLIAVALTSCESQPPVAEQTLILALPKQPTSVLYVVAYEHGLFKKHGLKVELKIYPSGKRALEEGLLTGAADIANAFDTPSALAVFDHPEMRVLASTMRADNISFIVARRDRGISQPGDLRGRHVATQAGSAIHFFLYQFLLEQGIGEKDITVTFAKIEALSGLLESGQVDAVSIRDPYFSESREKLGDQAVIFSDPGIYEQTETLVTTEKFLRERPAVVKAVLAALIEAEAYAQPTAETAAIIAKYMDMSVNDALADLHNYHIRVEMRHSLLLLLEEVARWGMGSGLVHGEMPNYANILAPDALIELAPDRVTLIR